MAASKSPPGVVLAKGVRRFLHISDVVGDVFDNKGHYVRGHGGVDLAGVSVRADQSRLTVIFTCRGRIPTSSGPGMYQDGHDVLGWGADFSFTGNPSDMRRYFQLSANLVGTEWRGEVAIFVGPTKGDFKLKEVPIRTRNKVIISVPWNEPVTSTTVNGQVVMLPRLPHRSFVSTGTQWDFFAPSDPNDFSSSVGGDKTPDDDARVEFSL